MAADEVVAWDVMVHPVEPSRLLGLDEDLVSAPRIDNQLSCWAATGAIAGPDSGPTACRPAWPRSSCCSTTRRSARRPSAGAAGGFLGSVLERVAAACGLDRAGVPGRPGPLDLHVRRLRPRHQPELRRPPRAGPHDCVERRRGREGQRQPPLRDRGADGGRGGQGLPRCGRAAAVVRQPHRPGLRVHDRPADRGARWASPPSTSARRSWPCTPPGSCAAAPIPATWPPC